MFVGRYLGCWFPAFTLPCFDLIFIVYILNINETANSGLYCCHWISIVVLERALDCELIYIACFGFTSAYIT